MGLDYKFDTGAPAESQTAEGGYRGGAGAPATEPLAAGSGEATPAAEQYSFHGQVTWVPQGYSGPESLAPQGNVEEVLAATAFLGLGLWRGAAIYVAPEIDEGFGVGSKFGGIFGPTFGIAGFPNAFAYKVGKSEPYVRDHRYFLRQTIGLGGGTEQIESGADQLAGPVDANRLTFTVGKYSVVDIFDDNKYAHDPGNTFLNWTIIDMGAFGYAADSCATTFGTSRASLNFYSTPMTALWAVSIRPWRRPSPPGPRVKVGGGVNLEQQITPSLGLFARLSLATGQYETFEFTPVERSVSGGVVINGDLWGREKDQIGIGGVLNDISNAHANYFAAGGLDLLLGDGALSYSGERILETYYKFGIADGVHVTADYQFVDNPGYNLALARCRFSPLGSMLNSDKDRTRTTHYGRGGSQPRDFASSDHDGPSYEGAGFRRCGVIQY
jgi:high affinity Mn2+ porin